MLRTQSVITKTRDVDLHLDRLLDLVQRHTIRYFIEACDPTSKLPYDRLNRDGTSPNGIISIGGCGFAVMAIVVAVSRGWMNRSDAVERVLLMLNALSKVERFHGAFPHFIHAGSLKTCSFSRYDDGGDLVETALLLQGLLSARAFFDRDEGWETKLRACVSDINDAVEWNWYASRHTRPTLYWHWSLTHRWKKNIPITGWNEALIAYVLAAGAEAFPIDPQAFHIGWTNERRFLNGGYFYNQMLPVGRDFGGPLFLSQYSFCGLDPRGMTDDYLDYEQQVRAHATINYRHCLANPRGYAGYGVHGWGLTACDGPRGYSVNCPVRDRGVVAPTAALSSMPFLLEEAETALRAFIRFKGGALFSDFGFVDSFRPDGKWIASTHLAINQGPIVAAIENYRSGLLWSLFMQDEQVQTGLARLNIKTPYRGNYSSSVYNSNDH